MIGATYNTVQLTTSFENQMYGFFAKQVTKLKWDRWEAYYVCFKQFGQMRSYLIVHPNL